MKLLSLLVLTLVVGATQAQQTKTQWLETGGRKIAYRVFGKGNRSFWRTDSAARSTRDPLFIETLSAKNQVILFDYSGIGYSTGKLPTTLSEVAKDIQDLADGLQLKNVTVGGWSYGGLVAQVAAFQYPKLVSELLLIGTNPIGNSEVPLDPLFLEHALKPVNDFKDETVLFFEPTSDFSVASAKASHDRIYKNIDVSKIPSTQEVFNLYFAGGADSRDEKNGFRKRFLDLNIPILILSGDHDISFPVENRYSLNRKLPTSQHIVFPHTGHAPQHQFPELTADYISSFINRTK